MKKIKTNVLRFLDKQKIPYEIREYQYDEQHLSGKDVIDQVDLEAWQIYKTLVLKGNDDYLVCCIPVLAEIDLKRLAKATHHKSVEMILQKDLLMITGYMRGGCSPIGMKKLFPTYFEEDILQLDKVAVSAGKRGLQVILKPQDLVNCVNGKIIHVIKE
ncbi:Cys-tRNA(Pro) deacylase [Candidatus Stoquefichus sp. SB1]|uniref:Cys-tRNA(Pro) deacylase n=1 Tax=Candidatus Stoquefichus sp. SB1 TaxID=1658109 RepID=UPI00067E7444|nr:Cys-tRNA(Pro) deacylase [Candidatus Stoquefichus sp. SB1]